MTITVKAEQWEKKEDNYFHIKLLVGEVLENEPIIQIYQNTSQEPRAYNLLLPTILQVVEIPEAKRGFIINIALHLAIDGHVVIK